MPLSWFLCNGRLLYFLRCRIVSAYAAVSRYDESLHSARLAVDVAHDRLESSSKMDPILHTQSIILLYREDMDGVGTSQHTLYPGMTQFTPNFTPDACDLSPHSHLTHTCLCNTGPILDMSTGLTAAYYTLACQLFHCDYFTHAIEWFCRYVSKR